MVIIEHQATGFNREDALRQELPRKPYGNYRGILDRMMHVMNQKIRKTTASVYDIRIIWTLSSAQNIAIVQDGDKCEPIE